MRRNQRGQLVLALALSVAAGGVFVLERVTSLPTLSVLHLTIVAGGFKLGGRQKTMVLVTAVASLCLLTSGLTSGLHSEQALGATVGEQLLAPAIVLPTLWLLVAVACRRSGDGRNPSSTELTDLRESNKRFRQLLEHLREVFWITSSDGETMVYVSPAYEDIWGRTCSSLYQQPRNWLAAIHREDRRRVTEAFSSKAATGQFNERYRIVRPDGTERWIHDRGFPVRNEAGEVYRIAGLAEDVTQRKHSEEALARKQRQLLRSERLAAIGEMMAGLAHESRNALQRSQACLDMLSHRIEDRPRALNLLGRIQDAQNQLFRLYEDVREYAAPMRLQYEACDVHEVAARAWKDLAIPRKSRTTHLDSPQNGVSPWCRADPFALREIFVNTFSNALAACVDPVEVVVNLAEVDLDGAPALRISIRDNGPGLSEEQRTRAFEPFFTTKTRGTGLGMAIVQRIAEAHRGTVQLGDPTSGAEIIITLPRGEPKQ